MLFVITVLPIITSPVRITTVPLDIPKSLENLFDRMKRTEARKNNISHFPI